MDAVEPVAPEAPEEESSAESSVEWAAYQAAARAHWGPWIARHLFLL